MSLTFPSPDALPNAPLAWTPEDRAALETAVRQLERTTFAARLTGLLGRQLESAGAFIPQRVRQIAAKATARALSSAMHAALRSLKPGATPASPRLHRALATATGAAGGAFGLASLPVELPLSTVILLRSIADIARQNGEDLSQPEAALACMEVFALGSRSPDDSYMDSSYFAVRALLARTVSEAARYMAATAAADEAAPIMLRFIAQIATRFGLVVSQKFAAQAIPVIGAAGGAAVNYAFMDHFQTLARGHFTVRRLERKYGADEVKKNYNSTYAPEATI
ncbi:MAG: Peptidase [Hyphomicrobiales bacterium]|nr:Peptidase [Hyphomicrobiales bacterium]